MRGPSCRVCSGASAPQRGPALADKAIRAGMVVALQPGAWLDIPDSLRRADGESGLQGRVPGSVLIRFLVLRGRCHSASPGPRRRARAGY